MATAEWLATHRPVMAYLQPEFYAQLQEYKTTSKLSMSEAIKQLLKLGLQQQLALPPQSQDDALEETTPPQLVDGADEQPDLSHRVATLEAALVHMQGDLSLMLSSSLAGSGQPDAVPERTTAQPRTAQTKPEHTAYRLTRSDAQKVRERELLRESRREGKFKVDDRCNEIEAQPEALASISRPFSKNPKNLELTIHMLSDHPQSG